MQVHLVQHDSIFIPASRQRRDFDAEKLVELSDSITEVGLIQPIVLTHIDGKPTLLAGERRYRAVGTLHMMAVHFTFAGQQVPTGTIPAIFIDNLAEVHRYQIELEENIKRVDLSWTEKAEATARLMELRSVQAELKGEPPPTIADITAELGKTFTGDTRKEILIANYLSDPDVKKAKTLTEGFKIIKRKEELKRSAQFGESLGPTYSNSFHKLLKGDCLQHMEFMTPETFDIILTDPPYGMGADEFGDSGSRLVAGDHFYEDSYEGWVKLLARLLPAITHVAKPQAHLYMFCDIDRFPELKETIQFGSQWEGWSVFRTPLIWVNPTAMRAPWPDCGPQRKWQAILYAVRGKKPVTKIYGDVLTYPSDPNLNHQAQKPVALYKDLLQRSALPNSLATVLDPFCGTGPIFPAAHALRLKATGIELDPAAYGIAAKRLEELK